MKLRRGPTIVLAVLLLPFLAACPGTKQVTSTPSDLDSWDKELPPKRDEKPVDTPSRWDEGFREEKPSVDTRFGEGAEELNRAGVLKTVYFDYDQSAIRDDQRAILEANAAWLKANPSRVVEISGHCDERGSTEYNLALGDRRARSVLDYLSVLGVSTSRLQVVSYGEERPELPGSGDEAWRRNRRAEFLILE